MLRLTLLALAVAACTAAPQRTGGQQTRFFGGGIGAPGFGGGFGGGLGGPGFTNNIGGNPGGFPQGNILGQPCKKFSNRPDPFTGQYLCADSVDDALLNQGISLNNGGLPHNLGGTGILPGAGFGGGIGGFGGGYGR